jgi:hypothetical protein
MSHEMMAKLTFVLYIKQVKKMSTHIPFILDALLTSSTVEVQVRFSHSFCSEIFFSACMLERLVFFFFFFFWGGGGFKNKKIKKKKFKRIFFFFVKKKKKL